MPSRLQRGDGQEIRRQRWTVWQCRLPCSWETAECQRDLATESIWDSLQTGHLYVCFVWPEVCPMLCFQKKNHGLKHLRGNGAHLLFYRWATCGWKKWRDLINSHSKRVGNCVHNLDVDSTDYGRPGSEIWANSGQWNYLGKTKTCLLKCRSSGLTLRASDSRGP